MKSPGLLVKDRSVLDWEGDVGDFPSHEAAIHAIAITAKALSTPLNVPTGASLTKGRRDSTRLFGAQTSELYDGGCWAHRRPFES
jgi:hypothetical protein